MFLYVCIRYVRSNVENKLLKLKVLQHKAFVQVQVVLLWHGLTSILCLPVVDIDASDRSQFQAMALKKRQINVLRLPQLRL